MSFVKSDSLPEPCDHAPKTTKKADVAEHLQVFGHIGLLVNEPPGMAELLSI
jgi:hypothetical protein